MPRSGFLSASASRSTSKRQNLHLGDIGAQSESTSESGRLDVDLHPHPKPRSGSTSAPLPKCPDLNPRQPLHPDLRPGVQVWIRINYGYLNLVAGPHPPPGICFCIHVCIHIHICIHIHNHISASKSTTAIGCPNQNPNSDLHQHTEIRTHQITRCGPKNAPTWRSQNQDPKSEGRQSAFIFLVLIL